ncbi:MAG: hypothetical protein AAFP19_14060 [Bacteroidota bacterium]
MRILFAFLCICLFWTGCVSDNTGGADGGGGAAGGSTHVKASPIAPFIGLWSYSKAFSNNSTRVKDYEGRWVEFTSDGTFKSGRWGDENNQGSFSFDADANVLTLDYKNDQQDADMDWEVKLGGDVIIWLGNAGRNRSGDQIRMQKVQERPLAPAG